MALESLKGCGGGETDIWFNLAKNEMYTAFMAACNSASYVAMNSIMRTFTRDLNICKYKTEDVESQLAGILALIQVMNENKVVSSERIMKLVPEEHKKIEAALNQAIWTEQEKLQRYREEHGDPYE